MEDLKISDEDSSKLDHSRFPVARALKIRQTGLKPGVGGSQCVEELAENKLIDKGSDHRQELEDLGVWEQGFDVVTCQLGQTTRSTFLMVFSPDRTLMASTHGDHVIYITEIKTGKCVHSLKGHPRTPWCIEFHPSRKDILASGCLGGQVRIWDLHGGSALWSTECVVASLTFHPVEKFVVIATYNEILFWDWEDDAPKVKICTRSEHEKVRYVQFDRLGHQLITAIANVHPPTNPNSRSGNVNDPNPADQGQGGGSEDRGGGGGGWGSGGGGDDQGSSNVSSFMDRYERLMDRWVWARRRRQEHWEEDLDSRRRRREQWEEDTDSARDHQQDNRDQDTDSLTTSRRLRSYSMLDPEDLDYPRSSSSFASGLDSSRRPLQPLYRFSPLRRAHPATVIRLNPSSTSASGAGAGGPRLRSRLRRVPTFREPDNEPFSATGFRQELRQRMLEARRARRNAMMARESLNNSDATSAENASGSSSAASREIDGTPRVPRAIFDDRTTLSDRLLETVGPPERTRDMLLVTSSSSSSSQPASILRQNNTSQEGEVSTPVTLGEASRGTLLSLEDRMRRISRLTQTSGGVVSVTLTPRSSQVNQSLDDGVSTRGGGDSQQRPVDPSNPLRTDPEGGSARSGSGTAGRGSNAGDTNSTDEGASGASGTASGSLQRDNVQRVVISVGNSNDRNGSLGGPESLSEGLTLSSRSGGRPSSLRRSEDRHRGRATSGLSTQIISDNVMYRRMVDSYNQGRRNRLLRSTRISQASRTSGSQSPGGEPATEEEAADGESPLGPLSRIETERSPADGGLGLLSRMETDMSPVDGGNPLGPLSRMESERSPAELESPLGSLSRMESDRSLADGESPLGPLSRLENDRSLADGDSPLGSLSRRLLNRERATMHRNNMRTLMGLIDDLSSQQRDPLAGDVASVDAHMTSMASDEQVNEARNEAVFDQSPNSTGRNPIDRVFGPSTRREGVPLSDMIPPVSFASPAPSVLSTALSATTSPSVSSPSVSAASVSPRVVASTEEHSSPSVTAGGDDSGMNLDDRSSGQDDRSSGQDDRSSTRDADASASPSSSSITAADPSLTPTQIVDRLPVIASVGVPSAEASARSALLHEDDRQSPMLGGGGSSTSSTIRETRYSSERLRLNLYSTHLSPLAYFADRPPTGENSRSAADGSPAHNNSVDGSSRSPGRSPGPAASSLPDRYPGLQYDTSTRYSTGSPSASLRSDVLYTSAGHGDGLRRSPVPPPYDHRSLSRSPSRGGSGNWDPELAALRTRIAAGVRVGRRATADAPSTGGMADRIGLFSHQLSGGESPQSFPDNPFTSRPPSSASEVEIELPSSQNSTVSSPIPRPVTARGRYSVEGGRSSVDGHHGRASADSFRRSSSSDHTGHHGHHGEPQPHPPTPADVTAVVEEGFASDSSSSRPGSRLDRPDSRLGGGTDSRTITISNLNRRSVVRLGVERSSISRRNTLTRLMEEDMDNLRTTSTSSTVSSSYPRLSSPMSLPGRSPRADSDLNDPRELEEEEISLSQDSTITEDHTYSQRSLNRSLSEGSDGIQAEIHAEESNPPQELVALASVEDEIEISDNQIQIQMNQEGGQSNETRNAATRTLSAEGEDPVRSGEGPVRSGEDRVRSGEDPVRSGEGPVRSGEGPVVNTELSMYPTGARMSILDSDDDADMETSLREQRSAELASNVQRSADLASNVQRSADNAPSERSADLASTVQRSADIDSSVHDLTSSLDDRRADLEQPVVIQDVREFTSGGSVPVSVTARTIVEVPRSAIQPVISEEDEIMMNSVDIEVGGLASEAPQGDGARTVDGEGDDGNGMMVGEDQSGAEQPTGGSSQAGPSSDSRESREQTGPGTEAGSSTATGSSSTTATGSSSTTATGSSSNNATGSSTQPGSDQPATRSQAAGTSSSSEGYIPSRRQQSLDISRLARHIQHMQTICLESLEDLPQSRQRRQIIRLQGIRRMLEDLHRQIRNLQSTVQGAVASTSAAMDFMTRESPSASAADATADGQQQSSSLQQHHISPTSSSAVRHSSYTRTIRTRRRSGSTRTSSSATGVGGVLAARSRLTRAQSELVSRLHATVRAMEMSPDLTRRGSNSVGDRLTEASQSVLERHENEQRRRSDMPGLNRYRQMIKDRRRQGDLQRREHHRLQEQQHLLQDNLSYRNSLNGRCAPDSRRNSELNFNRRNFGSISSASSSSSRGAGSSSILDSDVTLTARNDLRSLSQRLERVLRQRREALEAAETANDLAAGNTNLLTSADGSNLLTGGATDRLLTGDDDPSGGSNLLAGPSSSGGGSTSAGGSSRSSTAAQRVSAIRESLSNLAGSGVPSTSRHLHHHHSPPTPRLLHDSSGGAGSLLHDSSTPSDSEEESYQSLLDSAVPPPPRGGGSPFLRNSPFRTSFSGSGLRRGSLEPRSAGGLDSVPGTSSGSNPGSVDQSSDPLVTSARDIYYSRLNRRRMGYVRAFERRLESRLNRSQLPPLSNLILRRLHRRLNAGIPSLDDVVSHADGDDAERSSTRTYREAIREMVDQLSIDQQQEAESNLGLDTGLGSGSTSGSGGGPQFDPLGFRRVGAGVGFSTYMSASAGGRNLNVAPSSSRLFNRMSFMARQRLEERQRIPTNTNLTYRIQTWDFWGEGIPDITQADRNIVVQEAKIHNDACVDISQDGCLLVTLAPCNLPMTTVVGLYSLDKNHLGQVLATYSLESCAVSVSLSPTNRHLLVGLTSRMRPSSQNGQPPLMAQVFRIKLPGRPKGERGRLIHRKDIHQVGQGHMSLNCIRWIPIPGQGFVFATNTGLLKILR